MSFRLRSKFTQIPDQILRENSTVTIGRNRICRIKNTGCARRMFSVDVKNGEIHVENVKNGHKKTVKSGEKICGPGFEYEVVQGKDCRVEWTHLFDDHLICGQYMGGGTSSFVASFDLDQTLISPKSGKLFPQNEKDWKFLRPDMPKLIQKLVNDVGYRFVIITNQLGISTNKQNPDELKAKLESILAMLNVPCTVYMAPHDDQYRKPNTGIWEHLCQSSKVNHERSFYVGDAAGRPKSGKLGKKDHSAGDLLFAVNNKLKFLTPEKFFARICNPSSFEVEDQSDALLKNLEVFHAAKIEQADTLIQDSVTKKPFDLEELPNTPHCIVLCGLQATGKSTFFRNHLQPLGYEHINRDTLKTMDKCYAALKAALKAGRKCVIDNTNTVENHRAQILEITKQFSAPCFLFLFSLPIEHVFHNLKYRNLVDSASTSVNKMVVYTTRKNFQEPKIAEGFARILHVNFIPKFDTVELDSLYSKYLCDK